MSTMPGTLLQMPPGSEEDAFSLLEPAFAVSGGGLALSQITEMTGLGPATIQNWVKRGWVSNPINKRYGRLQVARILLINLLRPAMKLERIVSLLQYVNGSVDDRTDDIIPEDRLYSLLCSIIHRLEKEQRLDRESIITLIGAQLEGYEGPVPDAKSRLEDALLLMPLNIAAAMLMQQADILYRRIAGE